MHLLRLDKSYGAQDWRGISWPSIKMRDRTSVGECTSIVVVFAFNSAAAICCAIFRLDTLGPKLLTYDCMVLSSYWIALLFRLNRSFSEWWISIITATLCCTLEMGFIFVYSLVESLCLILMNGEDRLLVTDELVQLKKWPVEVQDIRKITNHFWGICEIYIRLVMKIRKISTSNQLNLETLEFWPIMPKNLPGYWLKLARTKGHA